MVAPFPSLATSCRFTRYSQKRAPRGTGRAAPPAPRRATAFGAPQRRSSSLASRLHSFRCSRPLRPAARLPLVSRLLPPLAAPGHSRYPRSRTITQRGAAPLQQRYLAAMPKRHRPSHSHHRNRPASWPGRAAAKQAPPPSLPAPRTGPQKPRLPRNPPSVGRQPSRGTPGCCDPPRRTTAGAVEPSKLGPTSCRSAFASAASVAPPSPGPANREQHAA